MPACALKQDGPALATIRYVNSTFRQNNNHEKCEVRGLNGFISEKLKEKQDRRYSDPKARNG